LPTEVHNIPGETTNCVPLKSTRNFPWSHTQKC